MLEPATEYGGPYFEDVRGPCFACFEDALAVTFGDDSWRGGESAALDLVDSFEAGGAGRLQSGRVLAQTQKKPNRRKKAPRAFADQSISAERRAHLP